MSLLLIYLLLHPVGQVIISDMEDFFQFSRTIFPWFWTTTIGLWIAYLAKPASLFNIAKENADVKAALRKNKDDAAKGLSKNESKAGGIVQ